MSKSLEEIKADLEGLKKPELMEDLLALINEEKERGIDSHRKANREAENLRKYKKSFEALGLSQDDNLDEFVSSLIDKSSRTESNSSSSLTLKSLNEQISRITKERDSERQKSQEYQAKAKSKTISAKLVGTLSDKVYGADLLVRSLISDGTVDLDDNDNVVFKMNDETLSYETGINKLLEQRKDIVKSNQTGGAGTKVGNAYQNTNIESILKSNDKSAIKNNLKEVAGALGLKL